MQQMGDDESVQHRKELMEKIMQRDQASHTVALVIPTLHTQLAFNDMTGSGLRNHLGFLSGTEKFHEKLRLYFYPRIFDNAPVNGEDWSRFELEFFGYERDVNWVQACMPLLVATLVLFGWCAVNVRRFRLV
jgi:ABC-2 type transport system permease protein